MQTIHKQNELFSNEHPVIGNGTKLHSLQLAYDLHEIVSGQLGRYHALMLTSKPSL